MKYHILEKLFAGDSDRSIFKVYIHISFFVTTLFFCYLLTYYVVTTGPG